MSTDNADPAPTSSDATAAAAVPEAPVVAYEPIEPTDSSIRLCAYLAHRVIKALNDSVNEYTLPWEQARDSTVAGVRFILDNPKATPEDSHNSWLAYKQADGWVYGESKDPAMKTHPCMLPYKALPAHQRAKDDIFGAIVRTMFGL